MRQSDGELTVQDLGRIVGRQDGAGHDCAVRYGALIPRSPKVTDTVPPGFYLVFGGCCPYLPSSPRIGEHPFTALNDLPDEWISPSAWLLARECRSPRRRGRSGQDSWTP